ncbi:MAG: NADH-ubiquinone oxidoreductase-F iron-sulfur binding region domain-containing protein [Pseudomonadota bacterium]
MSRNLIALQNKFLGQGQTIYDVLARHHDEHGAISDADIDRLAKEHKLPPQHVRSTAKFYEELCHSSPARCTLKVCNGEACRTSGCASLESELCERLHVQAPGGVSAAGVRVEHVTCLGYCGVGPAAMVDGTPVSLAEQRSRDRVVAYALAGEPHGLEEPRNPVYLPADDKPCVLLRHFDRDVVGLEAAREVGVYDALSKAVNDMTPAQVISEVKASQLRGRGGAGFPTAIKLQTVHDAPSEDGRKFIVVNCDEGDAGSYIDKELIERDPHTQLEGALLAAYATGATEVILYIRFEYPRCIEHMEQAIAQARAAGLVGERIAGSDFSCEARVVRGQGAYICGEETSLLRSIEGVPAIVSYKPPFPAVKGLWGCPTAVNNVETLHNLSWIVANGGEAYAAFGHGTSRGTKLVSLNTRVKRPGLYEIELGTTLRELLFGLAGGMQDGQRFKAVQIGGPLGGILPKALLDTPLAIDELAAVQGMLGHASVVVYSQEDDLIQIGRALMHFTAVESCGKCFPCRIGSVRATELFDQMIEGGVTDARMTLLRELCETMEVGSLCALGGMAPVPIYNLLQYFPDEFERLRRSPLAPPAMADEA